MNASELSDRDFVESLRATTDAIWFLPMETRIRLLDISGWDISSRQTLWVSSLCEIATIRLDLTAALQRAETAEQKGRDYGKHIVELLAQIVDAKHETENVRVAFETACAFVLNNPKEVVLIGRGETDRMRVALKPLVAKMETAERALAEARKQMNTPELHDFATGVVSEAQHQRARFGSGHDAGKEPQDWFWLLGYLAGKALKAHASGDTEKALHHTISSAAILANWHAHIKGTSKPLIG